MQTDVDNNELKLALEHRSTISSERAKLHVCGAPLPTSLNEINIFASNHKRDDVNMMQSSIKGSIVQQYPHTVEQPRTSFDRSRTTQLTNGVGLHHQPHRGEFITSLACLEKLN